MISSQAVLRLQIHSAVISGLGAKRFKLLDFEQHADRSLIRVKWLQHFKTVGDNMVLFHPNGSLKSFFNATIYHFGRRAIFRFLVVWVV